MTALIIYITIAGSSVPWPYKVVSYPNLQACQAALPWELAQARAKYIVRADISGCVTLSK